MSENVNLPALGESVTEGTVSRWFKQVGDEVAVDEPLLEVSTDKVDTEIPSPFAGILEEILVDEDETAEVGAVLARIGDGSSAASGSKDKAEKEEEPAEEKSEEKKAPAASGESAASGDATEVTLPVLGESVTEGTVSRWLKEVGDDVEADEPLLEVSTDKVDTEIPSPVSGKLLEILVNEDETAEVGAVLARVGSGSAASSSSEKASAEEIEDKATQAADGTETEKAAQKAESSEAGAGESASEPGRGYVTPLVRRLAHQNGVDLSTVRGTGVGGRIRKQDVLAAALNTKDSSEKAAKPAEEKSAAKPAAKAPASSTDTSVRGTTVKAPRIRQVIAQRMRESLDLSTQLTQVHEVDLTRIVQMRAKAKNAFQQKNGVKLTYLPFIAQAVAEALKAHPTLNASFSADNKEITYHGSEDVAIAVDTERGLLVPVIKDASSLSLAGMAQKIADLADRARTNKLGADEMSGGSFSITNFGSVGALFDTPIINQPQVAILGTGAIVKRPMVVADADGNDTIAIRHMMYLALTYDHRLVDGADAGRFLQTIKARLEGGEFAAELGL
ncbi:2-oxoglutarate dehydrogenase, E2 component, dihydrolipoamide succinyltransferase [Micrococcus sp.]|uniref:2-oxoglutarate dehydrogenase, E2 component, dihydrolipoamide succinyltransferase n=1 Tax=Micrococcus sp. TaxID=1271 RepID=UPI002A918662|nr:2-oxoglutarate dehydrogenase, E2 component, dihydrolipoamide succinyltransferase [Micrococcus sp.]MDY6055534.1 2-oxoglutarate dehydrogenase, E2 component, dihydrolipoamide succinyltransferase [Micrococcus sp.]